MKRQLLLYSLAAAMTALVCSSYGNGPFQGGAGNRTGSTGSNANCSGSGCHVSNNSATTVSLTVFDANNQAVSSYTPGATYKVTIQGTNSNSQPRFGFQATCVKQSSTTTQAGTFTSTAANISVRTGASPDLVEHNTPIVGASGIYTASFNWTAPPAGTGTVLFYASLNAVNYNGSSSGDQPNTLTNPKSLTEATTATAISSIAPVQLSVYPNPVRDAMHVTMGKTNGSCFVQISDMSGKIVSNHEIVIANGIANIHTSGLATGNYYIKVWQDGVQYGAAFVKQ